MIICIWNNEEPLVSCLNQSETVKSKTEQGNCKYTPKIFLTKRESLKMDRLEKLWPKIMETNSKWMEKKAEAEV